MPGPLHPMFEDIFAPFLKPTKPCETCKGNGTIMEVSYTSPSGFLRVPCPTCKPNEKRPNPFRDLAP